MLAAAVGSDLIDWLIERLPAGDDIPEWFAFKSVVRVLREAQQEAQ